MNLKMGDTVSFVRNEIVDWTYADAGKMKGNYSAQPSSNPRRLRIETRSNGGSASILTSENLRQNRQMPTALAGLRRR